MNKKIKLTIIGIIFCVVITGVVYGAYSFYQINNPETLFKDALEEEQNSDEILNNDKVVKAELDRSQEPEADKEEEPYEFGTDRLNILLLGIDASAERYKTMGSFRTDTMMLISIDFEGNTTQIISIPRDSYVEIPGQKRREKINAAFVRGGGFEGGGFEKTMETVSAFFGGIPVHYYVGIDMNVVKEIIDIMGGLDYEVDVEVNIGGRKLEKGFQRLSGQQVLDYVRTRHTARGDIDRIGRQQKIVLAVFDQLKSTKQIAKIPQFYSAIMDKVHTNMNLKQITALALFATKLEMDNIQTYTVAGEPIYIDGISYWAIDQYKKKELVAEVFGIDIEIDPTLDLKYLKEQAEKEQKALAEAIQKGRSAIKIGEGTLSSYSEVIKDSERAKLEDSIRLIKNAIDREDVEGIYKGIQELYRQNDIILPLAIERCNAIENARAAIAEITNNIKSNRAYLLKDEEAGLQNRINRVQKSIASKDVQAIEEAVANLMDYGRKVFSSCEQRKNEQNNKPQPPPKQEKPPKQEDPKQEEPVEEPPPNQEPPSEDAPNQEQPPEESQNKELPQEQESPQEQKASNL